MSHQETQEHVLQELLHRVFDAEPNEIDFKDFEKLVEEYRSEDIALCLRDFSDDETLSVLENFSLGRSSEILSNLDLEQQSEAIEEIRIDRAVQLIRELSPDDRVDVLQEVSDERSQKLLQRLERTEPEAAEEVRELESWPEDSAGGLMTTKYVSLPPDILVSEAFNQVRHVALDKGVESIYYLFVCDQEDKLEGVLSLRDLIMSDPSLRISEVMTNNIVHVAPIDDQEQVADAIAKYNLSALPVIDDDQVMLGMVTVDDVMDVVIEEATEDAQLMGGVVPLEDSYFSTGLFEFIWKRGAWLVLLFFGQLITTNVMEANQGVLSSTMQLVAFIPLIIASGGNAGSQSSTLVIRAMAVGELKAHHWWRVLWRELAVGITLGLSLGAIGFMRAFYLGETAGDLATAIAVSFGIVSIVLMGTLMGSLFPIAIRRVGFDPAVSSTPFIASIVDVLGLVLYFSLARWVFAILV